MTLNTYLNFGGNCAEAFRYYEQNLGGKITMIMNHGQAPGPAQGDPAWAGKVLHARIELGGTALYGADIPSPPFEPVRSAYLSLSLDSIEEAERVYAVLSEGGKWPCPWRRRSSLTASPCSATSSACCGCCSTKSQWANLGMRLPPAPQLAGHRPFGRAQYERSRVVDGGAGYFLRRRATLPTAFGTQLFEADRLKEKA